MKALRLALKILLPLLLLAGGVTGMRALVAARQPPPKQMRVDPGPLVEVLAVELGRRGVTVAATGTVQASRQVTVVPQVSGRVVRASPSLVAGGFVAEGEVLLAVEAADYELSLERARAGLSASRFELVKTESQAAVARGEWERLRLEGSPPNPLVLYGPQLDNAQAGVAAAEAAVRQAELELGRTEVRAPFNARVRSEEVEVGQYLRAGSPAAALVGTDIAEVVVPLPLDDLGWLRVPGPGQGGSGSPAAVRLRAAGRVQEWQGRVARSLGEVDPKGRMARVVVEVADPYGLRGGRGGLDLELGAFVEVALQGVTLSGVVVLPRRALREGDTVWVVDGGDLLRIRSVSVARLERSEALVTAGLAAGDRVVLTAVAGAAEGMAVRPVAAGSGE